MSQTSELISRANMAPCLVPPQSIPRPPLEEHDLLSLLPSKDSGALAHQAHGIVPAARPLKRPYDDSEGELEDRGTKEQKKFTDEPENIYDLPITTFWLFDDDWKNVQFPFNTFQDVRSFLMPMCMFGTIWDRSAYAADVMPKNPADSLLNKALLRVTRELKSWIMKSAERHLKASFTDDIWELIHTNTGFCGLRPANLTRYLLDRELADPGVASKIRSYRLVLGRGDLGDQGNFCDRFMVLDIAANASVRFYASVGDHALEHAAKALLRRVLATLVAYRDLELRLWTKYDALFWETPSAEWARVHDRFERTARQLHRHMAEQIENDLNGVLATKRNMEEMIFF